MKNEDYGNDLSMFSCDTLCSIKEIEISPSLYSFKG